MTITRTPATVTRPAGRLVMAGDQHVAVVDPAFAAAPADLREMLAEEQRANAALAEQVEAQAERITNQDRALVDAYTRIAELENQIQIGRK